MIRFACSWALVILVAAGCSSTPTEEAANAADQEAPALNSAAEPTVVELAAMVRDPADIVRCRQMLHPASNVIVTRCLSGRDWERFERQQERWAKEILRTMQGGAYR